MKHTYWNVSYMYYNRGGDRHYKTIIINTKDNYFNIEAFNSILDQVGTNDVVIMAISNLGQMTKEEWEGIDEQSK